MSNDMISDSLARLNNAIMRRYEDVALVNTKMNLEMVKVLKQEDFIVDYSEDGDEIIVKLAYHKSGEPKVENFERVSKPGQRIYVTKKEIIPVMNGRGISIISTSSGLMTGAQAKSQSLGGEYLCKVW